MKNTILHSRESETKEPSVNIIKRCAFTLAEVLITLAVIGVVAALTIPTVVHKYQQKQLYTQFMKVYNTIQKSIQLAIGEHGLPSSWSFNGDIPSAMEKYIYSNLKVVKTCTPEEASSCLPYDIETISGGESFSAETLFFGGDSSSSGGGGDEQHNSNVIFLADGSILNINSNSLDHGSELAFKFDTNGLKGPNTMGRDVFVIMYLNTNGDGDTPNWIYGISDISLEDALEGCNPNDKEASGEEECAARLLLEGKMNY